MEAVMWQPLTMFTERKEAGELSMTRVIAWMFAVTYCFVLVKNASNAHAIGWPFCALGVVTVLAVPLQSLFKSLQRWVSTPPGKKAVEMLLSKLSSASLGAIPSTTATTVTTSTGPAPAEPEPQG
jgi:hypothetical protein